MLKYLQSLVKSYKSNLCNSTQHFCNHLLAFLWSIAACIISISNDIITKFYAVDLNPIEIMFFRFFFSFITLLPIYLCAKPSQISNQCIRSNTRAFFSIKIQLIHLLRGALLVVAMSLWIYNASKLPLHIITIGSFMIPFFNIISSRIFLKETLYLATVIYILASFLSILFIFHIGNFEILNFVILVFAGFLFSLLDILNKRMLNSGVNTMELIFFSNLYSSMISFVILIIVFGYSYVLLMKLSSKDLLLFLALGMGGNGIIFCILRAFRRSNLSSIQYVRYLEFPISCICGVFFLSETISNAVILASFVILACNILSFRFYATKS